MVLTSQVPGISFLYLHKHLSIAQNEAFTEKPPFFPPALALVTPLQSTIRARAHFLEYTGLTQVTYMDTPYTCLALLEHILP